MFCVWCVSRTDLSLTAAEGRRPLLDSFFFILYPFYIARVVKLVDTYASGAYAARHGGSSPLPGTRPHFHILRTYDRMRLFCMRKSLHRVTLS